MQVKDFMNQPYVASKDLTLLEAAKIMSSKQIGSLIYTKKNKAHGIITNTDLLKNFGKSTRISRIMSKNLISISPEDTIETALKTMKENKIKRLPVIDVDKKLIGIISMTDIAANIDKFDGDFFFN
jgi:CBS domain-containing protein